MDAVSIVVLESLQNHWEGLTRFVTHPGTPMDNNAAEQAIRTGAGRKNYYGSGSDWSADIAAFLFSIFMTLKLWGINPKIWLNSYLEACAANGRKPPEDISPYLPWLMSEEMLAGWQVIHSQAFILATHFLFVHCIYHPINKRSKACDRASLNIGNT